MPTLREPYSPLHQSEEQPDTVSSCSSPGGSGLQGSRNVGIPRMDLDTEEIRETHNLYIENHLWKPQEYYQKVNIFKKNRYKHHSVFFGIQ